MSTVKPCKRVGCKNTIDRFSPRRYCCDACKQAEYRKRKKDSVRRSVENPTIHSGICAWCCEEHFWTTHVCKKYCCGAHKQAAYRSVHKNHQPMMDFGV